MKVKIICPEHGIFEQTPAIHSFRSGCPICFGTPKKTTKEFVKESKIKHKGKYDYSLVAYKDNKTKVKIICEEHGVFKQRPKDHLNGNGCPLCFRFKSKGEELIEDFLNKHKIRFNSEFSFEGCENKNLLRFDFFLPDHNTCIEYDGEQHFKEVSIFGGKDGLKKTKENDKIKNTFCLNNNINLIRIPYNKRSQTGDILTKKINPLK